MSKIIDKEKTRAYNREYYKRNRLKAIAYQQAYHNDNPEYRSTYNKQNCDVRYAKKLFKQYGITIDQYNQMLIEQNYKCRVCFSNHTGRKDSRWLVDHDHSTGKVRGLLCHKCNTALGLVDDSISTLRAMITYLKGDE